MASILSSAAIKVNFKDALSKYIPVEDWQTRKTLPLSQKQLLAFTKRIGLKSGVLIIFVKYGKLSPSHFPEICIGNVIISLVFYIDHADVTNWINTIKNHSKTENEKALILGMMKPFYLKWGEKIYKSLHEGRYQKGIIEKHLADTATKRELSSHLSEGCSLAIYVGHGRSRGWSGYRGVRWKDISLFEQKKPIGNLISLSCSSLKNDKEFSLPFGLQYVMEGRCSAFIGTWDEVKIKPLEIITDILLTALSNSKIRRIHELILHVHRQIIELNDSEVSLHWSKFKLIGNPYELL